MQASKLYPALRDRVECGPVFAILADDSPTLSMGVLWLRLKVTTRLVWCHAACLCPDKCMLAWAVLTPTDRTALYCALANMIDFFDEAGA
jgi:hypothetical protein